MLTRIRGRFVRSAAMLAASPVALAPSYMDAFATSIAVNSHMRLWYSKIACSSPCMISAWYGV